MGQRIELSKEILEKAEEYYQESGSLTKTSEWVSEGCPNDIGIPTEEKMNCSRQPLRRIFAENNVQINPPNGGFKKKVKVDRFVDEPEKKLAATMIALALYDIKFPDEEEPQNYLSACYFVLSEVYEIYADCINIPPNRFPKYMNLEKVRMAADMYYEDFLHDDEVDYHFKKKTLAKMKRLGIL